MLSQFRPAIVLLALFTLLTGLIYPLAITGISQVLFPVQANGSFLRVDGRIVGSALIGQAFTSDRYFSGRPSATNTPDPADSTKTVDAPYNAANSAGSNLGPTSKALVDRVTASIQVLHEAGAQGDVPADAVTTSASGLDPHISPAFAALQVPRVARVRGLPEEAVRELVARQIEGRTLGIIGEPRVNFLMLNLALDKIDSGKASTGKPAAETTGHGPGKS